MVVVDVDVEARAVDARLRTGRTHVVSALSMLQCALDAHTWSVCCPCCSAHWTHTRGQCLVHTAVRTGRTHVVSVLSMLQCALDAHPWSVSCPCCGARWRVVDRIPIECSEEHAGRRMYSFSGTRTVAIIIRLVTPTSVSGFCPGGGWVVCAAAPAHPVCELALA